MLEKVSRDERIKAQQDRIDAFKTVVAKKFSTAADKLNSNS